MCISCVSACGHCLYRIKGMNSHGQADEGAVGIGWIFRHLINGTHTEYVRVPFADTSLYHLPESVSDSEGVLLSDILPTGHEIGVQYGRVKPGDVVAVIGSGPVGLGAIIASQLYGPSKVIAIDLDDNRVRQAAEFGATDGVNSGNPDWKQQVMAMTDGLGVDVAIEAVGIPATSTWAWTLFVLAQWLPTRESTEMLLKVVTEKKLQPEKFVSHTFELDDIMEAYDVFSRAAETKALKVILSA